MRPPIAGVLFDKDGTLFDFQSTWAPWAVGLLHRFSNGDAALTAHLAQAMALDLTRPAFLPHSTLIAGTNAEVVALLHKELPHIPCHTLLEAVNRAGQEAVPVEAVPLQACLSDLRARGLRLGVATNDAESSARAQLDRAGVTHVFDFISGFDSGYGGKPSPGMGLGFCATLGLDPASVVMVGDSSHDLEAGRAAGMVCVAVLTGVAEAQDLAPLADAVLPDIGHLARWITQQS